MAVACAYSVRNRGVITEAGGVEAIIKSMEEHPMDTGVQQNGCGSLWNLAVWPATPTPESAFCGRLCGAWRLDDCSLTQCVPCVRMRSQTTTSGALPVHTVWRP